MTYTVTYLQHHLLTDAERTTATMTQDQLADLITTGNITLLEATPCTDKGHK